MTPTPRRENPIGYDDYGIPVPMQETTTPYSLYGSPTPRQETPTRYVVYCRTSSDQQDVENSIAGQRSAAEQYVKLHGGVIVDYYVDEAKSGRVDRRPAFQKIIEDGTSDDPPFDVILVWKLNRFARNVKDMIRYWDLLEDHGTKVVSIMEPIMEGPLGKLMRVIIAGFDEFFSENMASDIKRGMRESAERGFYPGNRAPLGYRIVKVPDDGDDGNDRSRMRPKLELDEDWAPLARHIFDLALKDLSTLDIARQLDAEGYLTRDGNKFTKAKVHSLLRNRSYTGYVAWDIDKQTGEPRVLSRKPAHPAIVTPEKFEKVKQKLKSRAPDIVHPRTVANDHVFNDIGKCSQCGSKMKIKSGKGGAYYYFICAKRDEFGKKACDMEPYSEQKNTPIIMQAIIDDILVEDNVRTLVEIVNAEARPTNDKQQQQLAVINQQIEDLDQQEKRLLDAYVNPNFRARTVDGKGREIQERIAEQEAKKAEVESQMGDETAILDDPERIIAYAKDVRTYLQQENVRSVNAICKRFIKTIWFEPGYATIEHRIPIPDGTPKPAVKSTKVALQRRVRRTVSDGCPAWVRTRAYSSKG